MMRDRGVHLTICSSLLLHHGIQRLRPHHPSLQRQPAGIAEGGFIQGFSALANQSVALDANAPPVPGARLGRDESGQPARYVPNPVSPGKYVKMERHRDGGIDPFAGPVFEKSALTTESQREIFAAAPGARGQLCLQRVGLVAVHWSFDVEACDTHCQVG